MDPVVRSLDQLKSIYKTSQSIIENLDEAAMNELFSGNLKDVDMMLQIINEEVDRVLFSNAKAVYSNNFGYLDKLTQSIDESLKVENLLYFIVNVLNDFDINYHHIEWSRLVELYKLLCIICSRGHGKSFFFSNAYIAWKMYRYKPLPYTSNRLKETEYSLSRFGMLITNESTLAANLLEILKENIEGNDILRERLYPGKGNGEGWGKEKITCKNGSKLLIRSFGSRMRGFHPGYFVLDDFLVENVIYSGEQRDKYNNIFYGTVLPMLLAEGQGIVVGTPFCSGDLYDKLKSDRQFRVFEYPCIWPDTGEVLYPKLFSFDKLMAIKESQGSIIFSREYLVKPITEGTSIFSWNILKKSFIGMEYWSLVNNIQSFRKKFQYIVVGTDFAISAELGADESSFVVLGVDEFDIWVLHIFHEKGMTYDYQMAVLKQLNSSFYVDLFVIETNQMQKIFAQMAKDAGLNVMEHQTSTDKYSFVEGLPALNVLFDQGHIKCPRGDEYSKTETDYLCTSLNGFVYDATKGKIVSLSGNDHVSMALWQGVRGCKYLMNNTVSFNFI